jgi:hypothetical protein
VECPVFCISLRFTAFNFAMGGATLIKDWARMEVTDQNKGRDLAAQDDAD